MHVIRKLLQRSLGLILDKETRERWIAALAYVTGIDLLSTAHGAMGIGIWGNVVVSGEDCFVRRVLPCLLKDNADTPLVLFDVGANKGEYSSLLLECFPKARIHAFEPNAKAFGVLEEVCARAGIQTVNMGLSSCNGTATLTVPQENLSSSHGTLHSEVFQVIHHSTANMVSEVVNIRTVDGYAQEAGITTIDFMKIDTEGHELAVLQGCSEMLRTGTIRVIQFEFNQMNVISRVFLRDFYDLLDARYELFRITPKELAPLGPYNTRNEIFVFQNIVAILKPLAVMPELSPYIRR